MYYLIILEIYVKKCIIRGPPYQNVALLSLKFVSIWHGGPCCKIIEEKK